MKRSYNVGLAILRSIMCFMVVLCHCWDNPSEHGIMKVISFPRYYAVTVFMLMSFVLIQKTLVLHEKNKIYNRLERLLIPQIGWAIIYWLVYRLMDLVLNRAISASLVDMLWQIFSGHSPRLNSTMWYQVDLIYITIFFLLVILFFKRKYGLAIGILGLAAIVIQYSGLNMVFEALRYELKYPIGRFLEMLPIAALGFLISEHNILERLKNNAILVALTAVTVIGITEKTGGFIASPGYGYSGMNMLSISFSFFALFYVLPLDRLNNNIVEVIKFMTRYTMGIYCMHRLIRAVLDCIVAIYDIPFLELGSFSSCIGIYLIAFICSFIGDKIVGKTKLKALFD